MKHFELQNAAELSLREVRDEAIPWNGYEIATPLKGGTGAQEGLAMTEKDSFIIQNETGGRETNDFSEAVYEKNATLYKLMANPKRLHILNLLAKREMTVEELSTALGARMANVSQHLAVLRSNRFVRSRREGLNVFYKISDIRIVEPCGIFKQLHGL